MNSRLRILVPVFIVLMTCALPVTAIPSLVDSGVSSWDSANLKIMEKKESWTSADSAQDIAAWVRIAPGSDVVGTTVRYYSQYRIFTPDGKDWLKDIKGYTSTYDIGSGKKVVLSEPRFFRGADASAKQDEYGGPLILVGSLLPKNNPGKNYQWEGTWTVEVYIHDTGTDPRLSTLAKTLTFTLSDSATTPVVSKTTTAVPVTEQVTSAAGKTAACESGYGSSCGVTAPITQSAGTAFGIGGEGYSNADVQKTGAAGDSTVEKCPTWRGSDWSGTGDYYLSHGGDSLTYTITAPSSGRYVVWMRDWSDTNHASSARQVSLAIDGKTIGTYDAASSFNKGTTGYGWDKLTTVDLAAGSHTVTITKTATTSSAAIIDHLLFTPDAGEVPVGAIGHSESLCAGAAGTTATPMMYCTAPLCDSGKFVCNQGDGCPGGCGMSCAPAETTTKRSGIETTLCLFAIGAGILWYKKRVN